MHPDNFYSTDRLVAFGLELATAQQMVSSMSRSLRNRYIPGPENHIDAARAISYYVILGEKQAGPFTERELTHLIADGQVAKDTYVWHYGMVKWEVVENVPAVLSLVALTPPPFNHEESNRRCGVVGSRHPH